MKGLPEASNGGLLGPAADLGVDAGKLRHDTVRAGGGGKLDSLHADGRSILNVANADMSKRLSCEIDAAVSPILDGESVESVLEGSNGLTIAAKPSVAAASLYFYV